ncbi:DUF3658 domain-containing protein [Crenobacter caeni]|uniref:DUF1835 domain-containing protein n=1 Tax=Crenobacter caeni TaxID=2705474 RepID=A0A6B2KMJ5_9NEIS|nr:DUF3658 domain-containing protein [Crenobacter caeni]NDV11219.1 DUF1835 domain-containing protein [Crenobacter caeni]
MLHVTSGGAAADTLETLCAGGRLAGTVLGWPDDLGNGPLADADQVDPQLRTAHWLRLLQAYPHAGPDWDEAWQRERAAACRALLQAWEQGTPLTVWVGNHAGDALLLRLLAAQCPAQCELRVVDVSLHLDTPRPGLWAVGLFSPAELAALSGCARLLGAGERQALAAEWAHWQDSGDGVREVVDGVLQGRPLSCYDSVLLEMLARHGSVSAARLVGEAMGGIDHAFVGDLFLFWRLQVLAARGELRLDGAGHARRVEAIRP